MFMHQYMKPWEAGHPFTYEVSVLLGEKSRLGTSRAGGIAMLVFL